MRSALFCNVVCANVEPDGHAITRTAQPYHAGGEKQGHRSGDRRNGVRVDLMKIPLGYASERPAAKDGARRKCTLTPFLLHGPRSTACSTAGFQDPASFIPGRARASPSDTQGGSRMRECRTYGSVRGAHSNARPYRDPRFFKPEFVRRFVSMTRQGARAECTSLSLRTECDALLMVACRECGAASFPLRTAVPS